MSYVVGFDNTVFETDVSCQRTKVRNNNNTMHALTGRSPTQQLDQVYRSRSNQSRF